MARSIVVKVGTSTLTDESGRLDVGMMRSLADQIAALSRNGVRAVLVSSGAVRAGMDLLGWPGRPRSVAYRQAAAAVGQGRLMAIYAEVFREHGLQVGQILLTRQLAMERVCYVNAQNTLHTLLREGAVPIVNENDTVAVEELQFGDNDTLAALVAALVRADLLVLLTNVAGLLDAEGHLVRSVPRLTPAIHDLADGPGRWGSGGMRTKLEAARIAGAAGVGTVIAHGRTPAILERLAAGTGGDGDDLPATWIAAAERRLQGRKHWLAYGTRPAGSLVVNTRARQALVHGRSSLLPAGVVGVHGPFGEGEAVSLRCENGEEFARGLSACDWRLAQRLMGLRTQEAAEVAGRADLRELVHRDDLVLLDLPDLPALRPDA